MALAIHWLHRPREAPRPPEGCPAPIVDRAERREEFLARYQAAQEGRR